MYINRYIDINNYVESGKVLLVFGPRQIGKTSLVRKYLENTSLKYKFVQGEYEETKKALGSLSINTYTEYVQGLDVLVVDEAQAVPNIGTALKLLVDTFPNLIIIATGSSSFELAGQVGEPLTGRAKHIDLFSIWEKEMIEASVYNYENHLDYSLRFGRYPAVLKEPNTDKKKIILEELINSYLLKDIYAFENLKKSNKLLDLLRILAYQVGNEVSINEIASKLGISRGTVERYIDLFEKTFIVFRLTPYSNNKRKEIGKKSKIYFYDLGIRNGLIRDYIPTENRRDLGALWENFLILERMKRNSYLNNFTSNYFWRARTGGEIDYLEIQNDFIKCFEFKWNKKESSIPPLFSKDYNNFDYRIINKDNYKDFVL